MANDKLATQAGALSDLSNLSLTPYEQTVAEQLHLCRVNAKSEPDSILEAEFLREFEKENPEVLMWAFREHRRGSNFFPSIAEIGVLVRRRRLELYEASEQDRRERERCEIAQARADGKLVDFAEVKQKLVAVADAARMEPKQESAVKPFTKLEFSESRREELRKQAQQVAWKQS